MEYTTGKEATTMCFRGGSSSGGVLFRLFGMVDVERANVKGSAPRCYYRSGECTSTA